MLYKRVREKETSAYMKDNVTDTPYEFALQFEKFFNYDISGLVYLVEKAAYRKESVTGQDKQKALEIYMNIKRIIKEYKKDKKRGNTYET